MPIVDKPLSELVVYRPPLTRESDFDAFWARTLDESARVDLDVQIDPVPGYPVPEVGVNRLTYTGWAGSRISAWWLVPPGYAPGAVNGRRPVMVFSHSISMREKSVTMALTQAPFFFAWRTPSQVMLRYSSRDSFMPAIDSTSDWKRARDGLSRHAHGARREKRGAAS